MMSLSVTAGKFSTDESASGSQEISHDSPILCDGESANARLIPAARAVPAHGVLFSDVKFLGLRAIKCLVLCAVRVSTASLRELATELLPA